MQVWLPPHRSEVLNHCGIHDLRLARGMLDVAYLHF